MSYCSKNELLKFLVESPVLTCDREVSWVSQPTNTIQQYSRPWGGSEDPVSEPSRHFHFSSENVFNKFTTKWKRSFLLLTSTLKIMKPYSMKKMMGGWCSGEAVPVDRKPKILSWGLNVEKESSKWMESVPTLHKEKKEHWIQGLSIRALRPKRRSGEFRGVGWARSFRAWVKSLHFSLGAVGNY